MRIENLYSNSMGNHNYTPSKEENSKSTEMGPPPFRQPTEPDKKGQMIEDEFLEEFDNPSRGVNDHSFLKTEVSASNQRLSLSSLDIITLSRTITPKTSLEVIERTQTPSQAPSIFHFQSSEVTNFKEEWSQLVCWDQKSPIEQMEEESEQQSEGKNKQNEVKKNIDENQQKRLQQKQQQQDTTSTILRQLSGYILSEKNMFEPIKIRKESFVKFREEDISGDYTLLDKIGEGSYGKVYKAIHKRTKAYRAIKILKKTAISQAEHDKIMNEINILKKLDHPYIIKIFEVFLYASSYYIVTEYCQGGSLSKALKHKLITLKHAQIAFMQLANALSYIHSLNIIHRDIKLDNILLTNRISQHSPNTLDIRLIDFGLAKQIRGPKLKDRQKIGTYTYMAPEVLQGIYTPKCDLWSAGIALFYLIAHHHPFKGANKDQTFLKIQTEPVKLISDRWKEIKLYTKELVFGLLEKNYRHRLTAEEALRNPWLNRRAEPVQDKTINQAIKKLSDYHRGNNLVSTIESYIAYTSSTQKQIQEISRMFNVLDTNHDGLIQQSELEVAFKMFSDIFSNKQIDYALHVIQKQHEGKINYTEFVTMLSDRSKLFAKKFLIQAFEYLDSDKNGFLEKEELRTVLKGADCSELSCILEELDSNDDDRISLEEFIHYLRNENS